MMDYPTHDKFVLDDSITCSICGHEFQLYSFRKSVDVGKLKKIRKRVTVYDITCGCGSHYKRNRLSHNAMEMHNKNTS